MKILYLHQYFKTPSEPGGTRSYWFAKELIKNGHHVTMVTSRNTQEKLIAEEEIEGIQVIYVRNFYDNKMGVVKRLWSFAKFIWYSTRLGLKQKNIDLVFATSTPLTIGISALLIKKRQKTPYVFEVRDLWPEVPIQLGAVRNSCVKKVLYLIERIIYKNASYIIALSPGMKEGVLKQEISAEKVSVIPNMSKIDEFYNRPSNKLIAAEFGIDPSAFNVVHFGAMGLANGLETILQSAKVLKQKGIENIHFIFLGHGKTEEKLKEICNSSQLSNIKFLGEHSMKTVSEIVNICDCSLVSFLDIPILYTNSPNKLFDSLSAGKPIIVNSAGWTKKLVLNNRCGVYVNPNFPEELVDMLIRMQNNAKWVYEMGENSRKLAETVFDKNILSKEFVNIIEKVGHFSSTVGKKKLSENSLIS